MALEARWVHPPDLAIFPARALEWGPARENEWNQTQS